MSRKSKSCSDSAGKPEIEYDSQSLAQSAADYSLEYDEFSDQLFPYKCTRCRYWHLSPRPIHTPNDDCLNCGKKLYASRDDAERMAEITYAEKGIRLHIYKCPFDRGWHHTRKSSSPLS